VPHFLAKGEKKSDWFFETEIRGGVGRRKKGPRKRKKPEHDCTLERVNARIFDGGVCGLKRQGERTPFLSPKRQTQSRHKRISLEGGENAKGGGKKGSLAFLLKKKFAKEKAAKKHVSASKKKDLVGPAGRAYWTRVPHKRNA